ncbi:MULTISPECIES: hypothetical protein [unclassified Erwinia]|uniref:hypothetical protein n=1 Tax=unclassified Erwinia TaxID=2622719 RepID=UPI00143C18EA|nr:MULTISPECIES: hypothetical protein [unclassified Erwinia]
MSRKVNPYGAELKIARRQRRRLECDFNLLAESLLPQPDVPDMQIRDWSEGTGDRENAW